MPYVTSVERLALARGRRQGLEESIALDLEVKFGTADTSLMRKVRAVKDVERLPSLAKEIKKAATLAEVRALLRKRDK